MWGIKRPLANRSERLSAVNQAFNELKKERGTINDATLAARAASILPLKASTLRIFIKKGMTAKERSAVSL